jgi:hypothetical protein
MGGEKKPAYLPWLTAHKERTLVQAMPRGNMENAFITDSIRNIVQPGAEAVSPRR